MIFEGLPNSAYPLYSLLQRSLAKRLDKSLIRSKEANVQFNMHLQSFGN